MRHAPQCSNCSFEVSASDSSHDTIDEQCGPLTRREFVRAAGATAAVTSLGALAVPDRAEAAAGERHSEQLVEELYHSLTPEQKSKICFPWDYVDERGLLRTRVQNNWNVTDRKLNVGGEFFTKNQREIIEATFFGMYNPEWHDRIRKQLRDDAGGYGRAQTIAIFGEPGAGKYEFVMTGRHLTIRCDGDSSEHVAFGGPIFYGHASKGSPDSFNELPDHPGNVFWPQAQQANKLYQMLDGKQRDQALIATAPAEDRVGFQGPGAKLPGIPIAELAKDQKEFAQSVLKTLIDPFRTSDQDDAIKCLQVQGGLDACHLSFYRDEDIGNDGVWDVWRLEGPSFVWHFRGSPHVHVWVNVAAEPSVKLNAEG